MTVNELIARLTELPEHIKNSQIHVAVSTGDHIRSVEAPAVRSVSVEEIESVQGTQYLVTDEDRVRPDNKREPVIYL